GQRRHGNDLSCASALPSGHETKTRAGPLPTRVPNETRKPNVETTIIEIPALDAFVVDAEERGKVEQSELETLALEHDLDEEGMRSLLALLTERGVELPQAEEDDDFDLDLTPGSGPATTDSLGLFLSEIGRYQLLTAAEEIALA